MVYVSNDVVCTGGDVAGAHAGADVPPVSIGVPPPESRRVPGEEGLWVFIFFDMLVFAMFFGTIVVLHGQQTEMFRESQELLHPVLGLVNTGLLLTASMLVVLGLRGVRARSRRAAGAFAGALACAAGFAVIKGLEYAWLVSEGHTPGANEFFMYYFIFTGIHLTHLFIGMVVLSLLIARARRAPTLRAEQVRFIESGGIYWHMVDLLWLVLFPLLYLVR